MVNDNRIARIIKIVGEDKENADIVVSPYPSDHRAVVATFSVSKRKDIFAPDLGAEERP